MDKINFPSINRHPFPIDYNLIAMEHSVSVNVNVNVKVYVYSNVKVKVKSVINFTQTLSTASGYTFNF